MSEIEPAGGAAAKAVPQVAAPSNNRMIIAFPFSAVKVSNSDEAVSGLSALLVDLAELVAREVATPESEVLATRARALAELLDRGLDPK